MTTLWITSDTHNDLEKIAEAATNTADAWLDLGDEHDKDLHGQSPFYDHNAFVLKHPSAQMIAELLQLIEEAQQEYTTKEFQQKVQQLIQNPQTQAHVQKFVHDFVAYITQERKKLDEKFALYKKPKYRVLGNHDPIVQSSQLEIINSRIQDISGIKVAGATATGEFTHGAMIVAKVFPHLYQHMSEYVPVESDKDLEKITVEELRKHSPTFKALENQNYDIFALHAPIFEEFAANESDQSKVYDAIAAKLVLSAKKKPQIVIWGHDHYEYARFWKREGIVYAFVGPHRQVGLKFDENNKLASIIVKAYTNSQSLYVNN